MAVIALPVLGCKGIWPEAIDRHVAHAGCIEFGRGNIEGVREAELLSLCPEVVIILWDWIRGADSVDVIMQVGLDTGTVSSGGRHSHGDLSRWRAGWLRHNHGGWTSASIDGNRRGCLGGRVAD